MGFVKNKGLKRISVTLTEKKEGAGGYFEKGSIVTITDVDECRGYTFTDEYGNRVIEAGFGGFIINGTKNEE